MKAERNSSILRIAAILALACLAFACTPASPPAQESPVSVQGPAAEEPLPPEAAPSALCQTPADTKLVTQTPSSDAVLTIVNESDRAICRVFVSPQAQTKGFVDRLTGGRVAPGETYRLDLAPGLYKVHLNDCIGNVLLHREKLTVATLYELRLTNSDVQASACYGQNWEGMQLYYRGQSAEALRWYESALACYRSLGNRFGEGEVLNNTAAVYVQQGRYGEATDLFHKAEAIAQDVHNPDGESAALVGLSVVYENQRLYERALQALEKALAIRREMLDPSGVATILNNMGVIYSVLERYDEALRVYQEALDTHRQLDDPIGQAVTLHNIAWVFAYQRRYSEALDTFDKALVMAQKENVRPTESDILYGIGMVHAYERRFDAALDAFEEVRKIRHEVGNLAGEGHVLNSIGGVLKKGLERYDEALKTYEQAMDALESVRALAGSEEERAGFIGRYSTLYEDAAELYYQQERYAEAFQTSERGRARAFLDQIGNQRVDFRRGAAPELIEQEQALRRQILDLQRALDVEHAKPIDQQSNESRDKLTADLEKARKEYEALLSRLKLTNPEYAALVSHSTLSVAAVQSELLDEHTTLIEYFVLEDKILAWVIEQGGFKALSLSIRREDLRSQLESLRRSIAKKENFDLRIAARLYDVLFAPLTPYVSNHDLIIVPHDVLHYLPFAALWNAKSAHYLVEDYTITYAPSASVLKHVLGKRNPDEGRLLAMGNPDGSLPNAAAEAKSIAALYGTAPLLGGQATESQVYRQAGHVDVLHVAAHGVYDQYNPLFSRIKLAADDQNDGNLEVHEVYGLDLSGVNLVVLSACETALGEQTEGDELVGLTRAFLYAGTPAVVTTLWSIGDTATRVLMESFYRHLREGLTNAESLRTAQSEVMAQEGWRMPYYWAAFSLTGDYRGNGEPGMVTEGAAISAKPIFRTFPTE